MKAWFPERSEHLQTPALYPEEFERRLVGFFGRRWDSDICHHGRHIMKTWKKALIGIAIALVVLLVVAYFGMGYVIYDKLGNVKGSCDEHLANRPDNFALHPEWPAGFDVTPYFMSGYEAVKFPSRDAGIEVAGWWIPASPADPAAATVILVDGLGGCKNSICSVDARRDAVAQRLQRAADRPARHRRLHLPGRPLDHRQRGAPGRAGRVGLAGQGEGL